MRALKKGIGKKLDSGLSRHVTEVVIKRYVKVGLSPSLTVVFFFNKPKVKKRGFKNKEVEYLNRIEYNY